MESRLEVRRVRTEYLVPIHHPSPSRIKDHLDKGLGEQLARAVSATFSSWLSDADPSVWIVRRLDLDLAVHTECSDDQFTSAFASQFGRTLGAVLDYGEEQSNVVHFATPGAYLASFLQDLVEGHAWNQWYYESFAGLRMLSTSAALRTAVCDDSAPGRDALLQLSTAELQNLLQALTRDDASRILDYLAATVPAGGETACCELAWKSWQTLPAGSFDNLDQPQSALLLFLMASRDGEALGLNLKRAALALLCLSSTLADSDERKAELIRALRGGKLADLYQVARGDAEALAPLLHCSPDWISAVAQSINSPGAACADESARRYTSLGGVFLLLPFLDELPLVEACSDMPHADEAAAISLVRFLLLVKCCGQRNTQRTFSDSLLRDLLLIPPTISSEVIREWQSRITTTGIERFVTSLVEWQRNCGAVTDRTGVLAPTDSRGRTVLVDGARGLWVMTTDDESNELNAALRLPLTKLAGGSGLLLCDSSQVARVGVEFPTLKVISLEDTYSEDDCISSIVTRLDRVPDELDHLSLVEAFQLSPQFDLALSLAAQHVMRSFAARLSGFAQSNLVYIWTNFLDFHASMEEETERRVVHLGRPPLWLVLGFSGYTRQSYKLTWLDHGPLMLFEET